MAGTRIDRAKPGGRRGKFPPVKILGLTLDAVTQDEAVDIMEKFACGSRPRYIVNPNLDFLYHALLDPSFMQILNDADLHITDGSPLVYTSKFFGTRLPGRVDGTDVFMRFCERAAGRGYRIFLLGGAEGVAEKAAKRLEKDHPGIQIVGTYSPPFGFEKDGKELERINSIIRSARPHALVVGLGTPKGERWMHQNHRKAGAPVAIQIGGTFDWLAGTLPRPPMFFFNHGLGWLYRMIQEPKRLWRRYMINDLQIFFKIWKAVLTGRARKAGIQNRPRRRAASATSNGRFRLGLSAFQADGGKSGVSQYENALIRNLPKIDPDMDLCIFVNKAKSDNLPEQNSSRLVTYSRFFRNPVFNIIWHQIALFQHCRRLHIDLLHIPSYRRIPLFSPVAKVGTVHDLAQFHIFGKYGLLREFYHTKIVPFLIRKLDWVITSSHASKEEIARITGIPRHRIHVVHLGIDHDRFKPMPLEQARGQLKEYNLPERFILYVARLEHPGKNHVTLIRAFKRLKREDAYPGKLVLVGSDWLKAKHIYDEVRKLDLGEEVIFTGFVPDELMPAMYCAAEMFVFPSRYEGFGIPIIEAMACGTPVISSNAACLPEVVGDAGMLFPPTDTDGLYEAMLRLSRDEELKRDLRNRGLERAGTFSWERTSAQVSRLYRKFLSHSKTAAQASQ